MRDAYAAVAEFLAGVVVNEVNREKVPLEVHLRRLLETVHKRVEDGWSRHRAGGGGLGRKQ